MSELHNSVAYSRSVGRLITQFVFGRYLNVAQHFCHCNNISVPTISFVFLVRHYVQNKNEKRNDKTAICIG